MFRFSRVSLIELPFYVCYFSLILNTKKWGVDANPARHHRVVNLQNSRERILENNLHQQFGQRSHPRVVNSANKFEFEDQVAEPQIYKEYYPQQSPQLLEPQPEQNKNDFYIYEQPQSPQFQPPPNNSVYQQAQPVPFEINYRQVQKPPIKYKSGSEEDKNGEDNVLPYLFQSPEEKRCIEDLCICPMIYDPVCGFDVNPRGHQFPDKGFRTFGNACAFRCSQKCNKFLQFTYCGECTPNHYFPNPGDPAPSIECIINAPLQPQPLVEPQVLRREPREGSRILFHDEE